MILLQYEGDNDYLKLDKDSKLSFKLSMPSMGKFPTDFNLQWLRTQIKRNYTAFFVLKKFHLR